MSTKEQTSGFPKGTVGPPFALQKQHLNQIVDWLRLNYDVVAPTVGDAGIVLTQIDSAGEIAFGQRDQQSPGEYKLLPGDGQLRFSFNNGMDSPKKFLHPSQLSLFTAETTAEGFRLEEHQPKSRPLAFFGLSSCDLQAIHVLDRVFLHANADAYYRQLRQDTFILVVNCIHPGGTCFCASMGTGPKARTGFDIRLTELPEDILLESGSEAGATLLQQLPVRPADARQVHEAEALVVAAAHNMGRQLNTVHLPQILRSSLESPVWDVMKDWCLGCTNCTIVCPTCFCYDTADKIDMRANAVVRERFWDSCFTWQFAEVHGANFRSTLRARYRHWLCHKLSYWVEQYGMFGCVGCGRCLTWCPVKIDITEVAKAVRGNQL